MESNPELRLAEKYVNQTDTNIFLTGKAGTGKTTFLRHIAATTHKRRVVLAPTGIAALNAEGTTIHSFFQFSFAPYLPGYASERISYRKERLNLIRSLELIIIDEASMMRADILDHIDDILRQVRPKFRDRPFGGVQMLLIGDLSQLPPVVQGEEYEVLKTEYDTPYFFSSRAFAQSLFRTISLERIYRQTSPLFVEMLNRIRVNNLNEELIERLNARYEPDALANQKEGVVVLCTHNSQAGKINDDKLKGIKSKEYVYHAEIERNFPENMYPNAERLVLKQGAQVIFIANDSWASPRRYYNGSIGRVESLDDEEVMVRMEDSENVVSVKRHLWENCRYTLDRKTREIRSETIGTFSQFPLKLAWAITVHKSQGLTFDRVIIDANRAFTHGQFYVALSRCRSLEGVVLCERFNPYAVMTDEKVCDFSCRQLASSPDENTFREDNYAYVFRVFEQIFDFRPLSYALHAILQVNESGIRRQDAEAAERIKILAEESLLEICGVGERFLREIGQIRQRFSAEKTTERLLERSLRAAAYFTDKMKKIFELLYIMDKASLQEDEQKEEVEQSALALARETEIKHRILTYLKEREFDFDALINYRSSLYAYGDDMPLKALEAYMKTRKKDVEKQSDELVMDDLYEALKSWRRKKAAQLNVPAYTVISRQGFESIIRFKPTRIENLQTLKGIGKKTVEKYADEILEIVREKS